MDQNTPNLCESAVFVQSKWHGYRGGCSTTKMQNKRTGALTNHGVILQSGLLYEDCKRRREVAERFDRGHAVEATADGRNITLVGQNNGVEKTGNMN